MEPIVRSNHHFRFRSFELDPHTRELFRNGYRIRLSGQPLELLAILIARPGELVTREELQQALWPGDTFVDFEHSLNNNILKLRDALGDDAETPRFIETVPRLGYRFVSPVEAPAPEAPAPPQLPVEGSVNAIPAASDTTALPAAKRRIWPRIAAACFSLSVLAVAGYFYLRRPLPLPRITEYVQLTNDGWKKDLCGTDGSSLFVNLAGYPAAGIAQIPISGGRFTRIPVDLPTSREFPDVVPTINDISQAGSGMLVWGVSRGLMETDLWAVGTSGHPARYLAVAQDTAWSPDGKSVAFSNAHGDISVIPSDGGEARIIYASQAPPGQRWETNFVFWSPEGRRIRFTRDHTLWEIASDGSGLHKVLPADWPGASLACCGRWTPDGDFYLFLSGQTLLNGPQDSTVARMWAIDERRSRWRRPEPMPFPLTQGPALWGLPAPSRDGQTIFSRGITARGELVRLDPKTNQLEPYMGGISAEFVASSPDGKYVAYVSFPDGIMWRANRDGTGLMQLTRPPFYPKSLRWSPDGKQIAFVDYSARRVDAIYVVSAEGGNPERLLPDDGQPEGDPSWFPDGKKIVYCVTGYTSVGSWGMPEIRIVDVATRRRVALPRGPRIDIWSPKLSPDGRYVVGITEAQTRLYLFDMAAQHWSVFAEGQMLGYPTWSHDSRFVFVNNRIMSRNETEILRIPVRGGKAERLAVLKDFRHTGWYGLWMGLDAEDNPLLLRDEGTDEIYALTLERK